MAAITGAYIDLDAATLATMKAETLAAISACKVAGENYSVSGRSTGRNLASLQAEMAEIMYAISMASGARVNRTYFDVSDQ